MQNLHKFKKKEQMSWNPVRIEVIYEYKQCLNPSYRTFKRYSVNMRHSYTTADFIPLIAVVLCVTAATLLTGAYTGAEGIRWIALFMGFFFLVFGLFKAWNLRGFAEAYRMYDLIAMRSRFYAHLYPFIELMLGILYIGGWYLFATNITTLIVMTVSAAGVFIQLRKREEIPCACLGTVFVIPMTWITLGEDLLMAGMAAVMLVLL